jgi:hypothetical protein
MTLLKLGEQSVAKGLFEKLAWLLNPLPKVWGAGIGR